MIYTLEADVRGISTYHSIAVFARELVVLISACLFNVIVNVKRYCHDLCDPTESMSSRMNHLKCGAVKLGLNQFDANIITISCISLVY